jgi:GTPase SAR1 family protein
LKSLTNLREAFLVFLSLTVIALFNAGLLWEEQKISQQYMNFELTQMLELNENQMQKIRSIQAVYEIEGSKLISESTASTAEKINLLTRERNKQIMEVLNEDQKKILRTYCTDLVSFAKMFE